MFENTKFLILFTQYSTKSLFFLKLDKNETLKEKTKETMTEETEKKDETVLEMFASSDSQVAYLDESKLPKWLFKYLVFRFILLDRTGTKNSRLVAI